MSDALQPWGRWATFGLAAAALLAGQMAALVALTRWYGSALGHLPNFSSDGVAVSIVIFVSTPIQVALLMLFAQRRGGSIADYLGFTRPRRADVIVGIAVVIALIVAGNLLSWLLGRMVVTPFQLDIYRTAAAAGWLPWLWLGVVIVTPIGEETLFRGFLFRGLLRPSGDAWLAIVVTAALWAIIHVQYDWYVISQVFIFGLVLGWLRWASGSVLLTMLLHGMINLEGMLETVVSLRWAN